MKKRKILGTEAVVLLLLFTIIPISSSSVQLKSNDLLNIEKIDQSTSNLTEYWGCPDLKLTEGNGYFDTYQDDNGTWWFVTPKGYAFYSVGRWGSPFYAVEVLKKYNSTEEWANETMKIIKEIGFNTFGCHSDSFQNFEMFDEQIPFLYLFQFQHLGRGRWLKLMGNKVIPDVFDPYFWDKVEENIIEVTNILKENRYLIGYFIGNEIHWEPSPIKDVGDEKTLLEAYMFADDFYSGKQMAVEFLEGRYENNGGIKEFNRIWNMDITCWEELLLKNKLGREGWRIQSDFIIPKLKLFRKNPGQLLKLKDLKRAESDIREFTRLVAKWFFKNVTEILHKYDPNHLTLGVRFHAWGAPEEVIEECGNYSDVISINYYRSNLFMASAFDQLDYYIDGRRQGLVPFKNWMKNYYDITGKPLLVAEWGRGWPSSRLCSIFNLSEKIIANYQTRFTQKCMESSYVIGVEGNYHLLLLNESEDPYPLIFKKIQKLNSEMYKIHNS